MLGVKNRFAALQIEDDADGKDDTKGASNNQNQSNSSSKKKNKKKKKEADEVSSTKLQTSSAIFLNFWFQFSQNNGQPNHVE
jgi:hypothetical protein